MDKSKGDNLTIFVHGTFSNPSKADSSFINALSETFNEPVFQFDWSGPKGTHGLSGERGADNSVLARSNAGRRLSEFIKNHEFKDDESLNIVVHSHGGNVFKEYTKLFENGDKKVDSIFFLGTPHRSSHILNKDSLSDSASKINVYDMSDAAQILGIISDLDTSGPFLTWFDTFFETWFDNGSRDLSDFKHVRVSAESDPYIPYYSPWYKDHSDLAIESTWFKIQEIINR